MDQERIKELKDRIQAHPENVLDRFALAKIYFDSGGLEDAIKEFEALITLKPDYMICYVHMGDAFIQLNQKEKARAILKKGHELAILQKHQGPREDIEEMLKEID